MHFAMLNNRHPARRSTNPKAFERKDAKTQRSEEASIGVDPGKSKQIQANPSSSELLATPESSGQS
jgi:hypothetical protein